MVVVVVIKFYFDSFCIVCQCQQLMIEIDVEYWNIGFEKFLDGGNGVIVWGWVVRIVGEEDVVWIYFQYIFCRSLCWNDGQMIVFVYQYLQDVVFGIKIISYDVEWQFVFFFCFWQVVG